ncbi:penicillin-insensitive murein endopeptidase [Klebsiella aerogenes]|uniref:penicillin-insensitive murein endopeptidase n=1 Tax=Klebsiella aerogenes TaxID=548 RepID=UPI0007B38F37|nr:hypothetical protein A3N69_18685 [Klebsiella aerogenes]
MASVAAVKAPAGRHAHIANQHRPHTFIVRLRCPAGSLECEDQAPPPAGDGCGAELQSWFEPPKPGSTPPVKKTPPPLPPSCQALLDEHLL